MLRIFGLLSLFLVTAFAHKLNMFVQTNNNELIINSYFASGQGCHNCEVLIKKDTQEMFKGLTNSEGMVRVVLDNDTYIISVEAYGGHKVTQTVQMQVQMQQIDINKSAEKAQEESAIYQRVFAIIAVVLILLYIKRIKS